MTSTGTGRVDERAALVYRRQLEAAAIGGLILQPSLLDEVSRWLQPDDFANPVYAAWYTLLLDLREHGEPVDQVTLLAALRRTGRLGPHGRHAVELATITEHVPLPNAAASYCREVLHESIRRRLADTGIRLTQLATSTGTDTSDLLQHARTHLTAELETSARRLLVARPVQQPPATGHRRRAPGVQSPIASAASSHSSPEAGQ
jgi:replicative DNA helicase